MSGSNSVATAAISQGNSDTAKTRRTEVPIEKATDNIRVFIEETEGKPPVLVIRAELAGESFRSYGEGDKLTHVIGEIGAFKRAESFQCGALAAVGLQADVSLIVQARKRRAASGSNERTKLF